MLTFHPLRLVMITPLGIQADGVLIPYSNVLSVIPVERVSGWKIKTYLAVITKELEIVPVTGIQHVWKVAKEIFAL